jgi:acetyl-CoA carboxylase biotin carboxyl carrier protein
MTFQEIQELVKLLNKSNLAEFKLENGDFKISIRTSLYRETKGVQGYPVAMPAMQAPTLPAVSSSIAVASAAPTAAAEQAPAARKAETAVREEPAAEKAGDKKYREIKSPMVGTFYRSSSPDKDAFVEIGQTIKSGDTVCIIEAMKLFNEIESEFSGKVVKVMVDNAQPVEYDQVLFLIEAE